MLRDLNRFQMFPETLSAYRGHSLLVTNVFGQARCGIEGFYHHGTRFLSRLAFRVNDEEPVFVSANPVDSYSFIAYYLAPSPAGGLAGPWRDAADDGGEMAEKGIEIQVNRFVGNGLHQDVCVTNHGLAPVTITLACELAADYADMDEAAQGKRRQEAPVECEWRKLAQGGELYFRYLHAQLTHATLVRFPDEALPMAFRDGSVLLTLTLPSQKPVEFCMSVHPVFLGEELDPTYDCYSFRSHDTHWDALRDAWTHELPLLETTNPVVRIAWERAVSDLASLFMYDGEGAQAYTPAAGIPNYQALFGRDTLTTAWQSGMLNPLMLRGTIETIGRYLGEKFDDRYDEQPGRVIHQRQLSPLPLLGLTPFAHYYGDYAGPGMFLVAIGWYFTLTGDRDFVRAHKTQILRVLEWMDRYGDRDGDGFYEYATRAGEWGTKNQGWKDSGEAILYPDGRCVANPLAVVEIQGYYYAAKWLMGLTFLALGEVPRGVELLGQAADLKRRFNEAFWLPEEGTYALALDPDKRPVRSVASNMGQALACGIIDGENAARVADRLMAPDMFSGWGIRTLSSEHPAYNPFAYHLGTVWPSENGSIALGFRRYGLDRHLHALCKGLFDATLLFEHSRLPEVIGGHPRDEYHPHPGIYPYSCAPQAWSASALVMLVQSLLGLVPLAPVHTLIVDPVLPAWLPELTLRNIAVADARVSLRFRRDASGQTDYEVFEKAGTLRVVRQAPPDSLTAGVSDRLGDLLRSLLTH